MIKFYFLFILYCFVFTKSEAQISREKQYERLEYTCKVWGYLKYHHSNVCKGYINWDTALLTSLDGIKNAPTHKAFNDSLYLLVLKAGTLSDYTDYISFRGDTFLLFKNQLAWVSDTFVGDSTRKFIQYIDSKYLNESQTYASIGQNEQVVFPFESTYHINEYFPNENLRILALFRFWNCINNFYPFRNSIEPSWNYQLTKYLPKIIDIKYDFEYHLNFRELIKEIKDTKSDFKSYISDSILGFYYCPIRFEKIEDNYVITEKLNSINSVSKGDIIHEIDGISVDSFIFEKSKFGLSANTVGLQRNLKELSARSNSEIFELKVKDKFGTIKNVSLDRKISYRDSFNQKKLPFKAWKDTILASGCRIGIVEMKSLMDYQIEFMFEDLWNTDALILDLRGNTDIHNDSLHTSLIPFIYNKIGDYLFYLKANVSRSGEFYSKTRYNQILGQPIYGKKLILLIDQSTEDKNELLTLFFENHSNVIRIGTQTDATSGFYSILPIPGGINLYFTTLATLERNKTIHYPNGLKVDHTIKRTIEGVRNGKDELMEFALQCKFAQSTINDQLKIDVEIFPNPFVNEITIKSITPNLKEFTIFDLFGSKVYQYSSKEMTNKLELNNLAKGMYILTIQDGNSQSSIKLMKN